MSCLGVNIKNGRIFQPIKNVSFHVKKNFRIRKQKESISYMRFLFEAKGYPNPLLSKQKCLINVLLYQRDKAKRKRKRKRIMEESDLINEGSPTCYSGEVEFREEEHDDLEDDDDDEEEHDGHEDGEDDDDDEEDDCKNGISFEDNEVSLGIENKWPKKKKQQQQQRKEQSSNDDDEDDNDGFTRDFGKNDEGQMKKTKIIKKKNKKKVLGKKQAAIALPVVALSRASGSLLTSAIDAGGTTGMTILPEVVGAVGMEGMGVVAATAGGMLLEPLTMGAASFANCAISMYMVHQIHQMRKENVQLHAETHRKLDTVLDRQIKMLDEQANLSQKITNEFQRNRFNDFCLSRLQLYNTHRHELAAIQSMSGNGNGNDNDNQDYVLWDPSGAKEVFRLACAVEAHAQLLLPTYAVNVEHKEQQGQEGQQEGPQHDMDHSRIGVIEGWAYSLFCQYQISSANPNQVRLVQTKLQRFLSTIEGDVKILTKHVSPYVLATTSLRELLARYNFLHQCAMSLQPPSSSSGSLLNKKQLGDGNDVTSSGQRKLLLPGDNHNNNNSNSNNDETSTDIIKKEIDDTDVVKVHEQVGFHLTKYDDGLDLVRALKAYVVSSTSNTFAYAIPIKLNTAENITWYTSWRSSSNFQGKTNKGPDSSFVPIILSSDLLDFLGFPKGSALRYRKVQIDGTTMTTTTLDLLKAAVLPDVLQSSEQRLNSAFNLFPTKEVSDSKRNNIIKLNFSREMTFHYDKFVMGGGSYTNHNYAKLELAARVMDMIRSSALMQAVSSKPFIYTFQESIREASSEDNLVAIFVDGLSRIKEKHEENGSESTVIDKLAMVIKFVLNRQWSQLPKALECLPDVDTFGRMDPLFEFKRMTEAVIISSSKLKRYTKYHYFTQLLLKMYAATSRTELDVIFSDAITSPRVFSKEGCENIQNDILEKRYFKTLLSDRLDCDILVDHDYYNPRNEKSSSWCTIS